MDQSAAASVTPVKGMPLFRPGMSVAKELVDALNRAGAVIRSDDICVLAQKIVSKMEGRLVLPESVEPGADALRIAEQTRRDPHTVQLIISESAELMRSRPEAIIARHRTGHVLANAGIDESNVEAGEGGSVLLWPEDPDASARNIRAEIERLTGVRPAVLIADSMGRAWRIGTVGTAIGTAGITVLDDQRGTGKDMFGRTLQATIIAVADSIAGMASLVMGEGAEGTPAAIVRGAGKWISAEDGPGAVSGLRPVAQDMFR